MTLTLDQDRYSINYKKLETLPSHDDAKLLQFCNPHNPVGHVWSREEMERVVDICARKHYTDGFLDDFTVVAWDQRRTAGSYDGCDFSEMTIGLMVEDARALVERLCQRFRQDRIHICCGSWGTKSGTRLGYQYPEHIASYVGYGQLVDAVKNEDLSYQFAVDQVTRHHNLRELRTLEQVDPPVNGQYRPVTTE